MTARTVAVAIAAGLLCAGARAADLSARLTARNSVVAGELRSHVEVLANDTFEGREAGSRGGRAAAGYVAQRLREYGLHGAGDDGAFTQFFERQDCNLLALVPGGDPRLKQEYVVVGAHYDHVGYGNARNSFGPFGHIHNGADDNASGVSALLEIAQALSTLGDGALKRSVVLAFWDGEEKGLLGSKHWLASTTLELNRVRTVINVDMIGRLQNDRVEVFGTRTGYGLRKIVSRRNFEPALALDYRWELLEDSDHYPFFRHGIPALMFHTGKHADYHRPSDDVEKLNVEGIEQVARLILDVVFELADADELPAFRDESRREATSERNRLYFERPLEPEPARLGIKWRPGLTEDGRLVVTFVQPNTPAMRAGLRAGDRIVACDGRPLASEEQFQHLIVRHPGALRLTVVPVNKTEPTELDVQLAGPPVRIGITWMPDDAEPQCVLVRRVHPHSPAADAGMRPGDRIYAVDGHDFDSGERFESLLNAVRGRLAVTVERNGAMLDLRAAIDE